MVFKEGRMKKEMSREALEYGLDLYKEMFYIKQTELKDAQYTIRGMIIISAVQTVVFVAALYLLR